MEYTKLRSRNPLPLGLLGLLFLAGCGLDLFGGGNSNLGTTGPDGQCIRDLEALSSLLVQPKECTTGASCPNGSFCDTDRKACSFQCASQSDCPHGYCTCDGRCLAADAGPKDTAADPSCPRNIERLKTEIKGRACRFQEDCGHGARCDDSTKTCQYDCLGVEGETACGAGKVCDCFGRCVAQGADDNATPEAQLPVMHVSPRHHDVVLEATSKSWAPRSVDIKVTAATEKVALAYKPSLHVRADEGLYVTCDPLGRDSGFVSESCSLELAFGAAPYEKTQRIWVRPRGGVTDLIPNGSFEQGSGADGAMGWTASDPTVPVWVPTGGSVVPNGSFEQSDGGSGAQGWTVASDVASTWTRDTTVVKDGSSSVRFQVGPNADDGTWTILARRWVPVPTPGKYQVSYWYKSDQAAGSSAPNLDVWTWNDGVQSRPIRLFAPLGTNPWTRVVAPEPLVVEATTTRIDLEFITHKGTVWLDQVELVRLEQSTSTTVTGYHFKRDTSAVKDGVASLRLDLPRSETVGERSVTVDIPATGVTGKYLFSLWLKADNAYGQPYAVAQAVGGVASQVSLMPSWSDGTHDWERLVATAPLEVNGAEKVRVNVVGKYGTTWIDKIELVKIDESTGTLVPVVSFEGTASLLVSSKEVANGEQLVTFSAAVPVPGAPQPFEGEYEGVLEVNEAFGNGTGPGKVSLPITVWAKGTAAAPELFFHDVTRTIARKGRFKMGDVVWIEEGGATASADDVLFGRVKAQVASSSALVHNAAAGSIRGDLQLVIPNGVAPIAMKFRGTRKGGNKACASGSDCGGGFECEATAKICVRGSDSAVAEGTKGALEHRLSRGWKDTVWNLFVETGKLKSWLGPSEFTDVYSTAYEPYGIIGDYAIDLDDVTEGVTGYGACKVDFIGYVNRVRSAGYSKVQVLNGTETLNAYDPVVCDRVFPNPGSWERLTHVVCLERDSRVEPFLENARRLAGLAGKSPDCQRLFEAYNRLASEQSYSSYDTWLSEKCTSAQKLVVYDPSDSNKAIVTDRIYKCGLIQPFIQSNVAAEIEAERLLCYNETASEGPAVLRSASLDRTKDGVLAYSGDFRCTIGAIPSAVGLVTDQDRVSRPGYVAAPNVSFGECVKQIQRRPTALPSITSATVASVYEDTFKGSCFSPAKFYLATTLTVANGLTIKDSTRAYGNLVRLIQQWIALHSFVANRALNEYELSDILGSATKGTTTGTEPAPVVPATREEILDILEAGWGYLLDGNEAGPLMALTQSQLASPDYRGALAPANASHDQGIGLPVMMLEGLTAHLKFLEQTIDDQAGVIYAQCARSGGSLAQARMLDRIGSTIRLALAVEALAKKLADKAGVTPWTARWESSRAELNSVRARVLGKSVAVAKCQNPLGLAENDLPLFFGDPVGDSSRFFASSDYLMNTWAKPAVEVATSALTIARQAWLEQRSSKIQQQMTDADAARRLENLQSEYGRIIVDACGLTNVEAKDAVALLSDPASGVTPDNCFVEQTPQCTFTADDLYKAVNTDAARYQLCVLNSLRDKLGLGTVDPELATAASNFRNAAAAAGFISAGTTFTASKLYKEASFWAAASNDDIQNAQKYCADQLGGTSDLPSPFSFLERGAANSCFLGAIGEAVMAVVAAQKQIDIQASSLADKQELYESKTDYCMKQYELIQANNELAAKYRDHMIALRKQRAAKSRFGRLIKAAVSIGVGVAIVAATGGAAAPLLLGAITVTGTGLVQGGVNELASAGIDAAVNTFLDATISCSGCQQGFSKNAEDAKYQFETELRRNENAQKILACMSDTKQALIGIDTASLEIDAAMNSARAKMLEMRNLQNRVRQAVVEGRAAVEREKGRKVPSIAHHYWLDEKITRFRKDFDWSRRLTYMAMRAVEYEFQQSLPLREQILTATHPDQLHDAIRMLEQEQASRTINRRRPEETTLVMSLRDDILKLADRSQSVPAGERNWTATQRFQHLLWEKSLAIYDKTGKYLGQGISFHVPEGGALELRCAERLWRLGATIQGNMLSTSSPHAPVLLYKRNTFHSHWCSGKEGDEPYQVGALNPTAQLFRPGAVTVDESAAEGYSAALLYPWFNVRRSDFYKSQYQEGSSEELAGRGLFGEYVLVLPWKGLLDPESAQFPGGFPLEQVEDVLIRFDFLSVDNAPGI
ncbi:MAG: hypothetical protein HY698_02720 [Deltaproteobacteria bacterium]|nr:hypothetical protein [Deltaproteobacteria bacterium]